MENFTGYKGNTWKNFHLSTLIGGPRAEARLAFGYPPIGLRDEPIEFDRTSLALRLSNSIEPTPCGLRFARSAGTVNCKKTQFPPPADCGSSRSPIEFKKNYMTQLSNLIENDFVRSVMKDGDEIFSKY